jgi:hypothetical protein
VRDVNSFPSLHNGIDPPHSHVTHTHRGFLSDQCGECGSRRRTRCIVARAHYCPIASSLVAPSSPLHRSHLHVHTMCCMRGNTARRALHLPPPSPPSLRLHVFAGCCHINNFCCSFPVEYRQTERRARTPAPALPQPHTHTHLMILSLFSSLTTPSPPSLPPPPHHPL